MRDYLNKLETNQFMSVLSTIQLMEGKRNTGIDGPKLSTMLEEWTNKNNMTKEEHKYLKTEETYLKKFANSVYDRLSKKEQTIVDKKIMKYDFRLIDDYTLTQINRDMSDKYANAVVPRQQFYDWCEEIMYVKCDGCTQNRNECKLHEAFENNLVPESGFNIESCKYAYSSENLK